MQQPPPYYLAPYPNAPPPAPPHDGKATTSLVFGVLSLVGSMCYLGWLFGIVAIVLGVTSRRDIARSQGTIGGGGTAIAGIVTGSIGLGISLLYLAVMIGMWTFAMKSASHVPTTPPVYVPPAATATATSTASAPPLPTSLATMARVIDLDAGDGPLKTQLINAHKRAAAARSKLLVVTMSAASEDCRDIARAWGDARVQTALANVFVVRADVDDFHADLVAARMDRPDVPWFFLVGPSGNVLDAISADEWGANDARNIAPVIDKFVRGTLKSRKSSSGGAPL